MIRVISHSSKHHPAADQHIDCRRLPNPHAIPGFRPRDGRTPVVAEWVLDWPETQTLIHAATTRATDGTTIAVMCNAGRHRSVAVAEEIAHRLRGTGHHVTLDHLNLKPTKKPTKKTSDRGYGQAHQKLRAQWKRKVATGTIACWRCIERGVPADQALINPNEPWDLGHDDNDRTKYVGPEHRKCNRGEPSRRRARPQPHSRRW